MSLKKIRAEGIENIWARQGRNAADVIDGADDSDERRPRGDRHELPDLASREWRQQKRAAPGDGKGRSDDGGSAALRGRLVVRRSNIGTGERIGFEPRRQDDDQRRARRCRQHEHKAENKQARPAGRDVGHRICDRCMGGRAYQTR